MGRVRLRQPEGGIPDIGNPVEIGCTAQVYFQHAPVVPSYQVFQEKVLTHQVTPPLCVSDHHIIITTLYLTLLDNGFLILEFLNHIGV